MMSDAVTIIRSLIEEMSKVEKIVRDHPDQAPSFTSAIDHAEEWLLDHVVTSIEAAARKAVDVDIADCIVEVRGWDSPDRSLRNRVARAVLFGFDPTWSRLRWALQLATHFERAASTARYKWHREEVAQ